MHPHVLGNKTPPEIPMFHSSWPDQRSRREWNWQRFLQFFYWWCLYWRNHPVHCCICWFERGSHIQTTRVQISVYLRLNILIGIHELPQLAMYWDFDEFFGVEGFKKTIPKHHFMTLGKYLHLADPTTEDRNHLLCKVRPLVWYGLPYLEFLGDDDSKALKLLVEQAVYGHVGVEKLEHVGHVQKHLGSCLHSLKKKTHAQPQCAVARILKGAQIPKFFLKF